jgi:hypothetical protein
MAMFSTFFRLLVTLMGTAAPFSAILEIWMSILSDSMIFWSLNKRFKVCCSMLVVVVSLSHSAVVSGGASYPPTGIIEPLKATDFLMNALRLSVILMFFRPDLKWLTTK